MYNVFMTERYTLINNSYDASLTNELNNIGAPSFWVVIIHKLHVYNNFPSLGYLAAPVDAR